ncbi:hypothetical protein PR048_015215 [Dryococelus australis]|uniref:Uncharacterized protein n=1 Tax=Dryococelus australis TaxID=614101 RepID=A0ABQ9HGL1_9NEOP|nr:hypothetical protein PR048_015215 [Dryococelus australis]
MKERKIWEITEKTRRPAPSFGTIPKCENPGVARPGIELGSPWWRSCKLAAHLPHPLNSVRVCMYDENTRLCDLALTAGAYSNHRDSGASKWKKTAVVNKMAGRVAGMQGWGRREIPEETRQPVVSCGTIPTCKAPGVTRPRIEPGSPWQEASWLTAQLRRPHTENRDFSTRKINEHLIKNFPDADVLRDVVESFVKKQEVSQRGLVGAYKDNAATCPTEMHCGWPALPRVRAHSTWLLSALSCQIRSARLPLLCISLTQLSCPAGVIRPSPHCVLSPCERVCVYFSYVREDKQKKGGFSAAVASGSDRTLSIRCIVKSGRGDHPLTVLPLLSTYGVLERVFRACKVLVVGNAMNRWCILPRVEVPQAVVWLGELRSHFG